MRERIKIMRVPAMLCALLVLALLVPGTVKKQYEKRTLGIKNYEALEYEPYEIRYYDTFEDKLSAIADCLARGEGLYTLQIGERTDNTSDEELIKMVNEELEILYQKGILPEKITISSITQREFCELYSLVDTSKEDIGAGEPLRNIYFWKLTAITDTETGSVTVQIDSEFQKIYTVALFEKEENLQWESWIEGLRTQNQEKIAKAWISYWELTDQKGGPEIYEESGSTSETVCTDKSSYSGKAGNDVFWIYLYPSEDRALELYVNFLTYYKGERELYMGLYSVF